MNGNQNINVSFKVTDSSLSNYIDNIKKKSTELTNEAIRGAMAQTDAAKEQLRIVKEQIDLIEKKARIEAEAKRNIISGDARKRIDNLASEYEAKRNKIRDDIKNNKISYEEGRDLLNGTFKNERSDRNQITSGARDQLSSIREQLKETKLQTALSREQITEAKVAAREQLFEIRKGNKTLTDVYKEVNFNPNDEEKLTIKLLEEELEKDKMRDRGSKGGSNGSGGVLGSLFTVDAFNKVVATFSQLTQTQNGFDQIGNASRTSGQIIGAVAGGIIGGFLTDGLGAAYGAGIGSQIGGTLSGAFGDLKQREELAKQRFLQYRNRYRAISGVDPSGSPIDMEEVGVSASRFIELQSEFARRRGFGAASGHTTRDAIYAERGYGVDSGTSNALIEIQRSAKENNRDLAQLIGGVLERGKNTYFANGDNTFLNEFLNRFASFQKELLRTQTHVATGTTFDILSRFNSVGGMFDTRDPRSVGIISSINNSLQNPSSDAAKALEYYVLRQQNPGAGLFEIRKRMQQGLGNAGLLRGVFQQLGMMGGNDDFALNNLSGMFPGVPLEAIETLYKNKGNILGGNFSEEELRATLNKSVAENNTTQLEKNTAKIENAVLDGTAVATMAEAISSALKSALSGVTVITKDGDTFRFASDSEMRGNQVKAAQKAKSDMRKNAWWDYSSFRSLILDNK